MALLLLALSQRLVSSHIFESLMSLRNREFYICLKAVSLDFAFDRFRTFFEV